MSRVTVQYFTSKPASGWAGATEALLSLTVGWETLVEQQHVKPGEAMRQSSAAGFEG